MNIDCVTVNDSGDAHISGTGGLVAVVSAGLAVWMAAICIKSPVWAAAWEHDARNAGYANTIEGMVLVLA